MKKKYIALLMATTLVIGGAIGGAIAWLVDETDEVVNTFTTSDINISLTEDAGSTANYEFQMVPGNTIEKDPEVTVEAGSEACWLFVEVEMSSNYSSYLEDYEMANGWIQLTDDDGDVDGVYYQKVTANDEDQDFQVLKDDQVTVSEDVTKTDMSNLTADTLPTLTFTAYAVQLAIHWLRRQR